jgi:Na+/proline symporter
MLLQVPPATAYFIMGNAGATLILIMLFMAITATGASEMIAVSSLCTYDIYRECNTGVDVEVEVLLPGASHT